MLGPAGATGATGATGPQGLSGTNGTNGANGISGTAGVNSLVRQDLESTGANCADGGVRIESGLDLNGDGILEANEVTETSYMCNGIASLVNVVPEPAGSNCSAGGQAIQTGVDTNGDGILEPSEVQHTVYVCNGNVMSGVSVDAGRELAVDALVDAGTQTGDDGTRAAPYQPLRECNRRRRQCQRWLQSSAESGPEAGGEHRAYDRGLGVLAGTSQAQHATASAWTSRDQALHGGRHWPDGRGSAAGPGLPP